MIDIWSLLIDACRPLLCSIGRPLVGDRDEARSRRRGWMGRVMRPCHRHPLRPVQAGRLAAGVCYMRRCRVVQRRHACIVSMSSGAAPITVLRFRRRSGRMLRVDIYIQWRRTPKNLGVARGCGAQAGDAPGGPGGYRGRRRRGDAARRDMASAIPRHTRPSATACEEVDTGIGWTAGYAAANPAYLMAPPLVGTVMYKVI